VGAPQAPAVLVPAHVRRRLRAGRQPPWWNPLARRLLHGSTVMPNPARLPSSVVSRSSTHEMDDVQSSGVSHSKGVPGTGMRYGPGLVAGRGAGMTELEDRVRALLERGVRDGAATLAIDSVAPDVLAYLRTRLDEDDANDALSQWGESVWKDLRHFRWECSLRAWAYSLARHACARIRRRPHRHREQPLSTSAASRIAASIGASGALSSERQQKLALLRDCLDESEQELLTLRVDRELEWEEVAAILDVSAVTLRKRWERLVRKLEQMARQAGLLE